MSFQAEEVTAENDFSDDFDDDDTFLNLDEQGAQIPKVIPQSAVIVVPDDTETETEILNAVGGDKEQRNDSSEEWDDGMNEDSDIFLQVEDGSNYLKASASRDSPSGKSSNSEANRSFSFSQIPASNFQVTPPDFDDDSEDDELFSNIDLDIITTITPPKIAKLSLPVIDQCQAKPSFIAKIVANRAFPQKTDPTIENPDTPKSSHESTSKMKETSKLHARKSTPSRKTPSARRFPGPAGLIPCLKPVEFNCLDLPKKSNAVSRKIHDIISSHRDPSCIPTSATQVNPHIYCSQEEKSGFESRACVELLFHLNLNPDEAEVDTPLNLMNIDWIHTKASRIRGCRKVPFLLAVIQEAPEKGTGRLGVTDKAPCLTLTDPTGSIDAAIDANFLNVYGNDLRSGTALALKDVGLLRLSKRHVMLTITERNVICMTSSQDIDDPTKGIPVISGNVKVKSKARKIFWTKEGVRVTEFCDLNPENLLECYYKMNVPLDAEEDDDEDEQDLQQNIPIVNRNRATPTLFDTARRTAPSFVPPRSTTVPPEAGLAFVSNRFPVTVTNTNAAVVNVTSTPEDSGADFGDDDDDDFFRALDDIGLLNNTTDLG